MATYRMTRYPVTSALRDGTKVELRPMTSADTRALIDFFRRVPEDERFFLKDDVSDPAVIEHWAAALDYDRALPLIALDGEKVVADAVLIRHRGGYRRDSSEIRVVIDPEYRRRGLGTVLIRELVNVAWDAELDSVVFEMVAGVQDEAIEAIQALGAICAGVVSEYAKDQHGNPHDLMFLRLPLGRWWQWSQF